MEGRQDARAGCAPSPSLSLALCSCSSNNQHRAARRQVLLVERRRVRRHVARGQAPRRCDSPLLILGLGPHLLVVSAPSVRQAACWCARRATGTRAAGSTMPATGAARLCAPTAGNLSGGGGTPSSWEMVMAADGNGRSVTLLAGGQYSALPADPALAAPGRIPCRPHKHHPIEKHRLATAPEASASTKHHREALATKQR